MHQRLKDRGRGEFAGAHGLDRPAYVGGVHDQRPSAACPRFQASRWIQTPGIINSGGHSMTDWPLQKVPSSSHQKYGCCAFQIGHPLNHADIPQGAYVDGYCCLRSQRLPWLRIGDRLWQLHPRSSVCALHSSGVQVPISNDVTAMPRSFLTYRQNPLV